MDIIMDPIQLVSVINLIISKNGLIRVFGIDGVIKSVTQLLLNWILDILIN